MSTVRRSAGLAMLLLSVLGFLLCTAGVAGVWVVKRHVDTVSEAVFQTADEAFVFMETRLVRAQHALEKSRPPMRTLAERARRLKEADADLPELEPLRQSLDEVFAELKAAEHWLDASAAIAGGVHRVAGAIVESKTDEDGDESQAVTAARIMAFSADVAQVLGRLDDLRRELIAIRENREIARQFAAALITRAAELDGLLANVAARIAAFNAQTSAARASCADLAGRVHWWTAFVAVSLTLIALWFATSQVVMLRLGWRLTREGLLASA